MSEKECRDVALLSLYKGSGLTLIADCNRREVQRIVGAQHVVPLPLRCS